MKTKFSLLVLLFNLIPVTNAVSQKRIDLDNNHVINKDIPISQIAKDIKYIPLQTKEECLLSDELQISLIDNFIFVGDQQSMTFYRFDINGRFLNKIGSKGNGPGEYPYGMYFYVDDKSKEFYVISTRTSALFVYNYEGNFLKKINAENLGWNIAIHNHKIYYYNNQYNRIKNNNKVYELYEIDKKSQYTNKLKTTITSAADDRLIMEIPFFYSDNGQLFYKNPFNPYVYKIENSLKLLPYYEIDCGKKPSELKVNDVRSYGKDKIVRHIFENKNILLITYVFENKLFYSLASKSDFKFANAITNTESGFRDDIKKGPVFTPMKNMSASSNTLISFTSPENLLESTDNEFRKNHPWMKDLKADDNIVVVIAFL